jgi:ankyrin repeat protein
VKGNALRRFTTTRCLVAAFVVGAAHPWPGAGPELQAHEKKAPRPDVAALCDAAGRGKTAEVLALLKKGAPVNAHGPSNGKTPLVLAILHRHPETVKALLDNGADVHFADGSHRYPIYFCHISTVGIMKMILARGGDREVDLYAGATAKAPNGIGKTCLGSVCAYGQGDPEMIPTLVKAGADPNKKYLYLKSTPLILAVEQRRKGFDNAAYVKALIENGADVNRKSEKGVSPLQAARKKNDPKVIELLVKAGAKE